MIFYQYISKVIKKNLTPSHSSGLNNISNSLLRKAVRNITVPLSTLFYYEKYFPDKWKITKVVPLHKKDSATTISDHRSVSLPSSISKVMKQLIVNHMTLYLNKHNLLTSEQYVFQKKSSDIIQMIDCHSKWNITSE